jgi:hypothetical protein
VEKPRDVRLGIGTYTQYDLRRSAVDTVLDFVDCTEELGRNSYNRSNQQIWFFLKCLVSLNQWRFRQPNLNTMHWSLSLPPPPRIFKPNSTTVDALQSLDYCSCRISWRLQRDPLTRIRDRILRILWFDWWIFITGQSRLENPFSDPVNQSLF